MSPPRSISSQNRVHVFVGILIYNATKNVVDLDFDYGENYVHAFS
jgi:hypothetical protein